MVQFAAFSQLNKYFPNTAKRGWLHSNCFDGQTVLFFSLFEHPPWYCILPGTQRMSLGQAAWILAVTVLGVVGRQSLVIDAPKGIPRAVPSILSRNVSPGIYSPGAVLLWKSHLQAFLFRTGISEVPSQAGDWLGASMYIVRVYSS